MACGPLRHPLAFASPHGIDKGTLWTSCPSQGVIHLLPWDSIMNRVDLTGTIICIRIFLQNVQSGMENNFIKLNTRNLGTPYDYNSVMQYGRFAFSKKQWSLSLTIMCPLVWLTMVWLTSPLPARPPPPCPFSFVTLPPPLPLSLRPCRCLLPFLSSPPPYLPPPLSAFLPLPWAGGSIRGTGLGAPGAGRACGLVLCPTRSGGPPGTSGGSSMRGASPIALPGWSHMPAGVPVGWIGVWWAGEPPAPVRLGVGLTVLVLHNTLL
ncbi:uncharacterized protein LOC144050114 [Vanacampus margaritifer]